MTIVWLIVFLCHGMPPILWWPPERWSLTLYLCLAMDVLGTFKKTG